MKNLSATNPKPIIIKPADSDSNNFGAVQNVNHVARKLVFWFSYEFGYNPACTVPRGGTLIFCGYIGEAPASTPKPKKLLKFADHPKKIPVLSGIPKKILELLAYPKKLHVFIFFMPIDKILSHPYDLSCWWDVKSQINQPTEHVTIQLVYVGTRK